MLAAVALRDVPSQFLDSGKWAELRSFASNDLIALTYINAPYPDENDASFFFGGQKKSFDEALRCYKLGRDLVQECRQLLVQGKLIATRPAPNGKHIKIASDAWINLWPLFATARANGLGIMFEQIELYETADYKLEQDCVTWLLSRSNLSTKKKVAAYDEAKSALGDDLSHAIFNAAYKRVLGRKRGRPRKSPTH